MEEPSTVAPTGQLGDQPATDLILQPVAESAEQRSNQLLWQFPKSLEVPEKKKDRRAGMKRLLQKFGG
jgi:hypothetical protein